MTPRLRDPGRGVRATCSSCKAPIRFLRSVNPPHRLLPVDSSPPADVQGNVRLLDANGPMVDVLGPLEVAAAEADGETLYVSHFATCPHADAHRKARR